MMAAEQPALRGLHDAQLLQVVVDDEHGDLRDMRGCGADGVEGDAQVAEGQRRLCGEVGRERPIGVVTALTGDEGKA